MSATFVSTSQWSRRLFDLASRESNIVFKYSRKPRPSPGYCRPPFWFRRNLRNFHSSSISSSSRGLLGSLMANRLDTSKSEFWEGREDSKIPTRSVAKEALRLGLERDYQGLLKFVNEYSEENRGKSHIAVHATAVHRLALMSEHCEEIRTEAAFHLFMANLEEVCGAMMMAPNDPVSLNLLFARRRP